VRDFAVNNSNAISYKHLQFMFLKCVRPVMTLNGLAMYRVTQKNVITKNRITSKILFRLTQNFS